MTAAPLLSVRGLSVRYGALVAVDALDLTVAEGAIVALIGAGGAGKSSTLNAIMGLVPAAAGSVALDGAALTGAPPERRARHGLGFAPEGRRVFAGLTVVETLAVPCFASRTERRRRAEAVYDLFPQLAERRGVRAWRLSGGQQQMLAVGRALMTGPRVLMLDEPSLGLAPGLVETLFATLRRIAGDGTAILLAEQNAPAALDLADRGCVLDGGGVAAAGPSSALTNDPVVRKALLGAD
jgi:branched-chain amino acid transport system ATP-binding protein